MPLFFQPDGNILTTYTYFYWTSFCCTAIHTDKPPQCQWTNPWEIELSSPASGMCRRASQNLAEAGPKIYSLVWYTYIKGRSLVILLTYTYLCISLNNKKCIKKLIICMWISHHFFAGVHCVHCDEQLFNLVWQPRVRYEIHIQHNEVRSLYLADGNIPQVIYRVWWLLE